MLKHFKKYLFLFAVVFLFLTLSHTAFALEQNYPKIPGAPVISSTEGNCATGGDTSRCLPDLIVYIFYFALAIASILGILSIVISGVILLSTAGSPGAVSMARERIFGAVLGLILLMFSVVLLNTINPSLTNIRVQKLTPDVPKKPILGELRVGNGADIMGINFIVAPQEDETMDILPGFYDLINYCNDGSTLLVWKYQLPDQDDNDPKATVEELACGESTSIAQTVSYKWVYKEPGVYLFKGSNCTGNATEAINSTGTIPVEFQQKVYSALVVNGEGDNEPRYGFVLNENPDLKGTCSQPYANFETGDLCIDVSLKGNCGGGGGDGGGDGGGNGSICSFDGQLGTGSGASGNGWECIPDDGSGGEPCTSASQCGSGNGSVCRIVVEIGTGGASSGDSSWQCVPDDGLGGTPCTSASQCGGGSSGNVCRLETGIGTGGGGLGTVWQCVPNDGLGGTPCTSASQCAGPSSYCTSAEPFKCMPGGSSGLSCNDNPDCAGHCETNGGVAQCVWGTATNGQSSCFVSEDCDTTTPQTYCKANVGGTLCGPNASPSCVPTPTTYQCTTDGDKNMPCPTTGAADCGKTPTLTGHCDAYTSKCSTDPNLGNDAPVCTTVGDTCQPARCGILNGQPVCTTKNATGGLCNGATDCRKPHCTEDQKCVAFDDPAGTGKPCSAVGADADCKPEPKTFCVTGIQKCSPNGTGHPCTLDTDCGIMGAVCDPQLMQCLDGGPDQWCDPVVCEGGRKTICDVARGKCVWSGKINDICDKTCGGGPGTSCDTNIGKCVISQDPTSWCTPADCKIKTIGGCDVLTNKCVPGGKGPICWDDAECNGLGHCDFGSGSAACVAGSAGLGQRSCAKIEDCGFACGGQGTLGSCYLGGTGASCNPANLDADCKKETHAECNLNNLTCNLVQGPGIDNCIVVGNAPQGGPKTNNIGKEGLPTPACEEQARTCQQQGGFVDANGKCVFPGLNDTPKAFNNIDPLKPFMGSISLANPSLIRNNDNKNAMPLSLALLTDKFNRIKLAQAGGDCFVSADCPAGELCDNGICVTDSPGGGGGIIESGIGSCTAFNSTSIYIIKILNQYSEQANNSTYAGDGVSFYRGRKFAVLEREQIGQIWESVAQGVQGPNGLIDDYGVNQTKDSGKETVEDPRGNFLTITYSSNENGKNEKCGFHTQRVGDFSQELEFQDGNIENGMYVFPIAP